MKGYKAFEKGMICRGKQYAENTVFEEESAEICKSGMHFCTNPLDTLRYYPLIDSNGNMTEFAEVEALDEVVTDDNKKYCTKKLKVGAKLDLLGFIKASVEVTKNQIEAEAKNRKKDKLIKAGGDCSTLAGGYKSTLAGGDCSTLAGGYKSTLAGGNESTLAGGYKSKLAGGYKSTLAGGYKSTLAGGKHSIMVGDNESVAKGKIGALIVLVEREWKDSEYVIKNFGAVIVDGKKIKEDTFYKLENGEFVEVRE